MFKRFITFGGIAGALAVILGAMAAHALKNKIPTGHITEANLQTWETAARYQMYHSIVLLILGLLAGRAQHRLFHKAGYCFMIGIVLFSGSLYLLSTANLIGLTAINWLGPITPLGGLFFISGWLLLAYAGLKHKEHNTTH